MNKVKPTLKQAKALELIREGMKPGPAMREAGYSEKTSEAPHRNLLSLAGVAVIIEDYKAEYARVGITPSYMIAKTAQWLEAKKQIGAVILIDKAGKVVKAENEGMIEVDDYQIQIKAAEMVRKDWGLGQPEIVNNTQNNLIITDEQVKRIIGE